jgi:carbamoyltransferase
MKIVGLYNWHDGGYAVLEDGNLIEHTEFERYTRLKESGGDSLDLFKERYLTKNELNIHDIDQYVSSYPNTNLELSSGKTCNTHDFLPKEKIVYYPHHLCHAAHAYYSSNFDSAYVLTIDSEGLEDEGPVAICGWVGSNNSLEKKFSLPNSMGSIGKLWGRCTRYIFKLSAGYPRGHQAGSVMAMAAMGNPDKYYDAFYTMATKDFRLATISPTGAKRGVYVPPEEEVYHPYLDKFRKIGEKSEQEKFDLAAALQKVTEDILFSLIRQMLEKVPIASGTKPRNLCIAGGVSLNSVFAGKILKEFNSSLDSVFVPPVPYDGGLTIGACQYHWHSVLGNLRKDNLFISPYLGELYSNEDIEESIIGCDDKLTIKRDVSIDECVDLLVDNKIVSIFQGRSESGRRALGNRSILASPINKDMKDMINKKVKHRQWYRPFAPSVLEEHGEEWFEDFFPAPYMSFVFKFKEDKLGKAPAVEHLNKTARIQTVSKSTNENYYNLIKKFYDKTGVPMVLNTSFNDREPIVENPSDAIKCFLSTDIDYLYFADTMDLISKGRA